MNTPHKYADILRAIADGKPIQFKSACECGRWIDADVGEGYPNFKSGAEWRVKPVKEYPETRMTDDDFKNVNALDLEATAYAFSRRVANTAIRHAIDSGQVSVVLLR